jgi:hypothetical protein
MASTPPMNGGLWKRVVRCASTEGQEVGPRGRGSKRVIRALAEKVAVGQLATTASLPKWDNLSYRVCRFEIRLHIEPAPCLRLTDRVLVS